MKLIDQQQLFYKTALTKVGPSPKPSYTYRYYRLLLIRRLTEFIFCTLLMLSGNQLLIETNFLSPLWVISGVGLSGLFLRGNVLLPSIFIGIFLSYFNNHFPLPFCLLQSFLTTLTLYLIRTASLHWIGPVAPIMGINHFLKFVGVVTFFAGLHVFSMLLLFQYYETGLPFNLASAYLLWLAELNGILYLVPLCLFFHPFVPQQYFRNNRNWWIIAALIAIAFFSYWFTPPIYWLGISLLLMAVLNSYARYFGQIPTGFTLLVISIVYITLPFTQSPNALLLLTLIAINAIISLTLATIKNQYVIRR